MFEGPEEFAVKFSAFDLLHEYLRCKMGRIAAEIVCTPVYGAEKLSFEVVIGVNCLLRAHVNMPEVFAGQVRANGQAHEVDGSEPAADLFEAGKVAGVPCEKEIILIGTSDPAAPEGPAMVDKTAVRIMLGRGAGEFDTTVGKGLPPVEFMVGGDADTLKTGAEPEGNDEHSMTGQTLDRHLVKVIVMVMRQEYDINGRQILEGYTGLYVAPGAEERYGRSAVAPDRIGENIQSAKLNEERRVTDPCNSVIVCPLAEMQAPIIGNFRIIEHFLLDALTTAAIDEYPAEYFPERGSLECIIGIVEPPAAVM